MNNQLSKEARAGFRFIVSAIVAIPTFWWACWLCAQLTDGFRWWMIPTVVTQIALAPFAVSAFRSGCDLLAKGGE